MLLVYNSLEYEEKVPIKSPILFNVMCRLWAPICTDFKLMQQNNLTKTRSFFIRIIILTFLLKYYNNDKVMTDFNFALQDFYKNDLNLSLIFKLCEKYGRNISLKYVITAYNICTMFSGKLDFDDNKDFYNNFSKNIIVNKDFVNNATSDVIDITFDEFIEKYNIKLLDNNRISSEIPKMLHDSLTHVQKFTFIGYNNSIGQVLTPYSNDLNVASFAKNIFSKKFGLQTLYCAMSIGDILSYYYRDYVTRFYYCTTKNLVESRSERFVDKIGNIFNKLYVKNGDFTTVNAYLELVQNNVRYALRDRNKFEHNEYDDSEQLDFSKPYCSDDSSGRHQVDGTATITKIHKLCRLLDYNIISELVKMPTNMWGTILDAKRDKFDNIMDKFNLAIINCANLAFSTIAADPHYWKYYYVISFNDNITPTDIRVEFSGREKAADISYKISSCMNVYDYFNVVGDAETKTMTENRLKMVKQVETCLKNMKKLTNVKQVKKNINIITKVL